MATSTANIKKAEELLAQCDCMAIKMKVPDGKKKGEVVYKEVWQQSIVKFNHLPHQQCWSCKSKQSS